MNARSALNVDLTVNPELPKSATRQETPAEKIVMKTPRGRRHFDFSRQTSPIFGGQNEPPNKPLKQEWRPSGVLVEYNNRKHCVGVQRIKKGIEDKLANESSLISVTSSNCHAKENKKEPLESVRRLMESKRAMELRTRRCEGNNAGRSWTPDIQRSEYHVNRVNGLMSKIILF
eukprot:TRINITY_DN3638_c0_g4_i2.p2 TRINITY_DN3638_c0_g4~~TRINITY_DN3638_c0_g4_i2.p2  ORF type:complete len:174 (+),score=40.31 TRINITY_DN3638_c0_g4_i2:363-884(+)